MKPYPYRPYEGRRSTRSPGLVAVTVLLSSFGLVALLTRAVDVGRNTDQWLDLERLRSELRHSNQENQALRQTLQRVGDRISSLELLAEEVQVLSRITSRRGQSRVPSQVYFSQFTFSEAAAGPLPARSKAFRSLFQNVDRQIDDLAQLYRRGYFKLTYTPSTWPVDGILGTASVSSWTGSARDCHSFIEASTLPPTPATWCWPRPMGRCFPPGVAPPTGKRSS